MYFILTAFYIRSLNLPETKTFRHGRPIFRKYSFLYFTNLDICTCALTHAYRCEFRYVACPACLPACHNSQFRTVNLIYGGRWPLADSTRLMRLPRFTANPKLLQPPQEIDDLLFLNKLTKKQFSQIIFKNIKRVISQHRHHFN